MMAISTSAPTFGSGDTVISQPTEVGGANGQYDSDNSYDGAGQSFTTGTNATGYQLKSFTYELNAANSPTGSFKFEIIGLTTPTTTISTNSSLPSPEGDYTVVGLDTATVSSSSFWPSSVTGHYLTFSFASPVTLAANTTYAFDVSGPTYFNAYHAAGESTPVNTNVSEIAVNEYGSYGGSVGATGNYIVSGFISKYSSGAGAYNRVFYADMTANPVPEPATAAIMALCGGLVLLARKRDSRQGRSTT